MRPTPQWVHVTPDIISDEVATCVAHYAHVRNCGTFDGCKNRAVPPPPFRGEHERRDVARTRMHLSDMCNALWIPPEQLDRALSRALTARRTHGRQRKDAHV